MKPRRGLREPSGPAAKDEATDLWEDGSEPLEGAAGPTDSPAGKSTVQLPIGQTVEMDDVAAQKGEAEPLARLKVVEGPDAGEVRDVNQAKSVLGRHPDCDVPLESMEASRHHAQILLVDGEWLIEDLHSRNGTLLNSEPLRGRRKLSDGDRIFIGDTALTFHPCRG